MNSVQEHGISQEAHGGASLLPVCWTAEASRKYADGCAVNLDDAIKRDNVSANCIPSQGMYPSKKQRVHVTVTDSNDWEGYSISPMLPHRGQELAWGQFLHELRPPLVVPSPLRVDVSRPSSTWAAHRYSSSNLRQQQCVLKLELELLYCDLYLFICFQRQCIEYLRRDTALSENVELALSLLLCASQVAGAGAGTDEQFHFTFTPSPRVQRNGFVRVACLDLLLESLDALPDNETSWIVSLSALLRVMLANPSSETVHQNVWHWIHRRGIVRRFDGNAETIRDDDASGDVTPVETDTTSSILCQVGTALTASMTRFPCLSSLQGLCLDILRQISLSGLPTTDLPSQQQHATGGTATNKSLAPLGHKMWGKLIDLICDAVTRYETKPYIQLPGLALLAWLSEDVHFREHVWSYRRNSDAATFVDTASTCVLDAIVTTMRHHTTDAPVQCNAVAALCWLMHNPASMSTSSPRHDIPVELLPVLVDTLERHVDDASVFGNIVCLLTYLPIFYGPAFVPHTPAASNRTTIQAQSIQQGTAAEAADSDSGNTASNQIVNVILDGMKRHMVSTKVQACCFWWMYSLVTALAVTTVTSNVAPSNSTSAPIDCLIPFVPLVVESMQLNIDDAPLQSQACFILSNLVDISSSSSTSTSLAVTAVRQYNSVDAILAALCRHGSTHSTVQQGAAWFLIALAAAGGGDRESSAAMNAFGGGLHVIDVICDGLGNIDAANEDEEGEDDRGDDSSHEGDDDDSDIEIYY